MNDDLFISRLMHETLEVSEGEHCQVHSVSDRNFGLRSALAKLPVTHSYGVRSHQHVLTFKFQGKTLDLPTNWAAVIPLLNTEYFFLGQEQDQHHLIAMLSTFFGVTADRLLFVKDKNHHHVVLWSAAETDHLETFLIDFFQHRLPQAA